MSSSLTSRVVQRSIRADTFIPDKIWKDHKLAVKKVLASPLTYKDPGDAGYDFGTQLLPIFQKTVERLNDIGGLPKALEQSLADRLDNITYVLDKLTKSAETFRRAYESEIASGPVDAESVVARSITFEIGEFYRETVKTVGDALKATWSLDPKMVRLLAKRLIKKATPDEQRAFVESETNFGGPAARLTYAFYDRVKLPSLAKKLVTREKVSYNFLGWGDFLKEVVDSNYSRKAEPAYRQFDLKGMKVVVDDQSVTDDQIKAYIRYLLEAEHRLRSKGFAKVWYGTVFISCESCGGVNPNTGGGTGGDYTIHKETVRIYSRPSSFIVELMAHELGHCFWFKQMTETQRERFKALVKTREGGRPEKTVYKKIEFSTHMRARNESYRLSQGLLKAVTSVVQEISRSSSPAKAIAEAQSRLTQLADEFALFAVMDTYHSTAKGTAREANKKAIDATWDAKREVYQFAKNVEGQADTDLTTALTNWLSEAKAKIERADKLTQEFLDAAYEGYNKWVDEELLRVDNAYQQNEVNKDRPVLPVSSYGASNIDEAFAEAFAHYIMGYDMTQDQIESFRAVLKTAGERIAEIWEERRSKV